IANPVESGPRCLRLLSIAVISRPTLVTPSRWMRPAIPHIWCLLCSGLPLWQAVEIGLDVPFRRRMEEPLPLVALVLVVEPVHFAWHRRTDHRVLLQRGKRVAERHWQFLDLLSRLHGLIDVALLRRPR